ncbi:hypothetical protein IP84_07815 [beta proteobacterium AAP99]|nr:hypothetical protein IP84_07815 [beta proteobacterium AAP99]
MLTEGQSSRIESAELRAAALQALAVIDPDAKVAAVQSLSAAFAATGALDPTAALEPTQPLPGRPARPVLVHPARVPRRSPNTVQGRAALLHALAHIEFNAINLALDAIWRFPGLPAAFYSDWLKVAREEALHFSLLVEHLHRLGAAYGDFEAHDGLWTMAQKTAADPLARMALVPRLLEARGLDASPPIRAKLAAAGDARAVEILDVIMRDEVGHVEIGNRWYRYLCVQQGREPVATFWALLEQYGTPAPKGPFNLDARRAAGFTAAELDALELNAQTG